MSVNVLSQTKDNSVHFSDCPVRFGSVCNCDKCPLCGGAARAGTGEAIIGTKLNCTECAKRSIARFQALGRQKAEQFENDILNKVFKQ